MKIKLLEKKVMIPGIIQCIRCGQPNPLPFYVDKPELKREVTLRSVDMIRTAIEANEKNLIGIGRIRKTIKLLDLLESVKPSEDGAYSVQLEDTDFDLVYESVDKLTWGPIGLKFPEFFDALEETKRGGKV